MTTERDGPAAAEQRDHDHLATVNDGCGCTEIWEHLAEERSKE
jgi:hypothetical protein